MPRKRTVMKGQKELLKNNSTWLRAVYHFHVFHYRMPETAAIAAVTPFVPSPLTVKMAMIASLFQLGDAKGAELLARHIHEIEVKIVPPKSAISFKAFLRYRSPPAPESGKGEIDETGSYYQSRPHMREYAIFKGNLEIYIKSAMNLKEHIEKALRNIRYLGSKDSMVTCIEISEVSEIPPENYFVSTLNSGQPGTVVLLADFDRSARVQDVKDLIPGNRNEKMYRKVPHTLPGKIETRGRSRLFVFNPQMHKSS